MKLFIDTADLAQIKEAWSWGIIDGVTTNPTHVMKTGRKPKDVYREILEIVNGPVSLETVSLELASRFAADAILDSYFGWDATRFPSRRAHNLVRARGQFSLARCVRQRGPELREAARQALMNRGIERKNPVAPAQGGQ